MVLINCSVKQELILVSNISQHFLCFLLSCWNTKIILFSHSDSLREVSVIKKAFHLGNHNFFVNTGEIFNVLK